MSSPSLIDRMLQTIKSGIHKKILVPWGAWQKHGMLYSSQKLTMHIGMLRLLRNPVVKRPIYLALIQHSPKLFDHVTFFPQQ